MHNEHLKKTIINKLSLLILLLTEGNVCSLFGSFNWSYCCFDTFRFYFLPCFNCKQKFEYVNISYFRKIYNRMLDVVNFLFDESTATVFVAKRLAFFKPDLHEGVLCWSMKD